MRSMFRFRYQYQDSSAERDTRKRRRLLGRLHNVCPHIVSMDPVRDEAGKTVFAVQYAFETPFGSLDYFCMFCNARRSRHAVEVYHEQMMRAFNRDPDGTVATIVKDREQADKLVQKLNRLGGAP